MQNAISCPLLLSGIAAVSHENVERIIQEVSRDYHINGSLSPFVLRRIVEIHRAIDARRTAETGCGLTTLIFSNLSADHTSFADGSGDSLPNTQAHPYFNGTAARFVVGPSQGTLPHHRFEEPLDLILLDGPHAYPFPDLEYYYFYPWLRQGGVLVIDDVHIPTIGNLYDFLREDEMWAHQGDVETTAFFRRTEAPTHPPRADEWAMQRYNRRYFPYPSALAPLFGKDWYKREFGGVAPLPATDEGLPSFSPSPELGALLDAQAAQRERLRANSFKHQLREERLAFQSGARALNSKIVQLNASVGKLRAEKLAAETRASEAERKLEKTEAAASEAEKKLFEIEAAASEAKKELDQIEVTANRSRIGWLPSMFRRPRP